MSFQSEVNSNIQALGNAGQIANGLYGIADRNLGTAKIIAVKVIGL